MSFDHQLERHLNSLPREQATPACLDISLRVGEWTEFYPHVEVPASFFSSSKETSSNVIDSILNEHSKSARFKEAKMGELEERLEDCEGRLADLPPVAPGGNQTDRVATLHSILEDIEQVNLELCLLEKFTATCRDSFDLHLNHVSPEALSSFAERVDQVALHIKSDGPRVNKFITRLSKVYDDLRSGGGMKEKAEAKVGTSFVRKSIKYWVHPDNLTEVKCHVLRHLPLFAFPNKDGSPHNPAITSVYYDNDNLDLYAGRLLKQDEAIALRIRWYGVPNQQIVYVENKIHYEDWTGEPSTKSRFALEEKLVNSYMMGTYTLDNRIKELIAQGVVPRKEIDSMDKLAKDVQKAVLERELQPMMRTFYNRTAFQLPDSARVRLSLDDDLTFVREDSNVVGRKLPGGGIDKNWRRRDVGIDWPFEHLPENEIHHFPYAVMEVKLQTEAGKEPPLWARELMQSQLAEEAPKFSKFVHGCVSLCEPLTPIYPYWLYQMSTDIRHRRQHTLLELTRTTVDVPWDAPMHGIAELKPAVSKHSSSNFSNASLSIATRTPLSRQSMMMLETVTKVDRRRSFMEKTAQRLSTVMFPSVPQVDDEKASTSVTPSSNGDKTNKTSSAGAPLGYLPTKERKLMVPTVVEPKVHFANERTFLGWTHHALFLINGAAAIVSFTAGNPRMGVLRAAGVVISVLGLLFLFVGLHAREARQKKITWNPEKERLDSIVPLFIILGTVTFAVAINWFAVFYY